MTILNKLKDKQSYLYFYKDKVEKNHLTKLEIKQLEAFINDEKYLLDYPFDLPTKKIISKIGSTKKRTVYTFSIEETWVLKLLTNLLYKYDKKLCDNCYSFRRNITAKTAFDKILKIDNLDNKYVLKVDIHDYFNSIDVDKLIDILKNIIDDDDELLEFLSKLLLNNKCLFNDEIIIENKGAMAGVPLASFFANFYLLDLDQKFIDLNIPYFRYSDDILIFTNNRKELDEVYSLLLKHIHDKDLTINETKLHIYEPHEAFEFLGFKYQEGKIDLSDVTIKKMKQKIKRKANSLLRKKKIKGYSGENTIKIMIRAFDKKFYDLTGDNEYTWTRYYFPIINVAGGLKQIDEYMLENIRYIYTGKHNKGNYKLTYEQIKKLGYTPLVSEYYKWIKDNRMLNELNSKH